MVAGCSAAPNAKPPISQEVVQPEEISFWNPFGGGEGEFVEQLIRDFNASQTSVYVKQLRLESNEYYVKLSTALSSGKGPDVAVAHVDRISPYIKAKQIMPLDGLAAETGFRFDEIESSNVQSVSYNGKPYAVPLDTHFHVLYYNKDILGKAGLLQTDGTPMLGEATPEGFVRMLEQIAARVPGVQPIAVNTPYFQEPFLNLYYEAGGDLLTPDMSRAAIHNEKALRVLTFYQELYAKRLADLSDRTPWDSFHSGKAALWFGGVWEAGHHLSEKSLPVGLMPLPPIFGSSAHWGSSHTLVVPSYVTKEKQKAAMAFMSYFSETGSMLWGQAGHVPANKAVLQSAAYRQLPYRSMFIEAKQDVKFAPRTDKYRAIFTALSEDLQSIVLGGLDPEQGLAALEKKINEIITN
ncbi:ABC transporter substrate-binding protein [Paenibacillus sp. GCM10023248]|uniref:ABC transporter substrate-binding protein n=1 Tax=Bacillales TaxID=1385 RepID=UPI002377E52A|nr:MULTISPECIES: ABC transporter substrate-binding protein [Bacillales]MDD9270964.1 ABC transporter substrate-binding protein [Paenibacillus sp. MAHUQ-63]MDR6882901.1 multiple sugar transport system substrate-binding protein [Bacillus sp. 3255]